MIKHGKKILVTTGAVAALAFGGATIANAGSAPVKPAVPVKPTVQPAVEQTFGPDRDSVQSGDQSTPDTPGSAEQPGADHPETSSETPGSEAPSNDGPGGRADEPGNANSDHQFNGQE